MYHSLTDFVEYLTLPALHYLLLDLIYALFCGSAFSLYQLCRPFIMPLNLSLHPVNLRMLEDFGFAYIH